MTMTITPAIDTAICATIGNIKSEMTRRYWELIHANFTYRVGNGPLRVVFYGRQLAATYDRIGNVTGDEASVCRAVCEELTRTRNGGGEATQTICAALRVTIKRLGEQCPVVLAAAATAAMTELRRKETSAIRRRDGVAQGIVQNKISLLRSEILTPLGVRF